jgi:radical SAM protein with 4Fe4S-binding SPASM domain
MGCNMRCKHCGSSCTQPLPDELTHDEAIALCDDIADLGLEWITLSGGEPLTRKDWPALVRRLRERGVIPNVITNGWMCTEAVIETAREAGVGTFAISLDGLHQTHDDIRKARSFERSTGALATMAAKGVAAGVITTVNKRNIGELDGLHQLLLGLGVTNWQLQIGLPMGNLNDPHNRAMVMDPEQVEGLIDFIHARSTDERMSIYPADCLGYHSRKEIECRTRAHRSAEPLVWMGCNAGQRSFGILHNGDILGCTSVRDRSFVEGSIRKRPLKDIWYDPECFTWNRRITKNKLGEQCGSCRYGDTCRGGCPNTRLTMEGTIYADNSYCVYALGLKRARARIAEVTETSQLPELALSLIDQGENQLAGLVLERIIEDAPDDTDALSRYGYVSYTLSNFDRARWANEQVLKLRPGDLYATKGLGVVLNALGEPEQAIACLRQAVAMAAGQDPDAYHDLAAVYMQNGMHDEARAVLDQAEKQGYHLVDIDPARAPEPIGQRPGYAPGSYGGNRAG